MIHCANLSKNVSVNGNDKAILKNITITFPEKGLVLVYGESGCGKTTFLNILEGLDKKYSGTVEIFGKNLKTIKKSDYLRNSVSIIFQEKNFINDYTVLENIKLIYSIKQKKFDLLQFKLVLDRFNMSNILNLNVVELSGGQRQILSLVLASMLDSKIVFCDEPTGSMDEENEIKSLKILKELSYKKLVVVVSHNVELFKKYADFAVKLTDGWLDFDVKNTSDEAL